MFVYGMFKLKSYSAELRGDIRTKEVLCSEHVSRSIDTAAGDETSSGASGQGGAEQSDDHGMLHFSLRYDTEASALVVTVVKATGLQDGDAEACNPYVKVRLLPDKHQKAKTKIVRRSVNPVFDETLTFTGVDAGRLQKRGSAVQLSVFNSDAFSKDVLVAQLLFSLHDVDLLSQTVINITRPLGHGVRKVTSTSCGNVR